MPSAFAGGERAERRAPTLMGNARVATSRPELAAATTPGNGQSARALTEALTERAAPALASVRAHRRDRPRRAGAGHRRACGSGSLPLRRG